MEHTCGNCTHHETEGWEYPCKICKGTAIPNSIEYLSRADFWDDVTIVTAEDAVNHPSHYNKGKIEVWDFISDWKLNFDRGNAIKYICRAGSKDPNKEIQDLGKAIEYINHEIKMLKGETENGTEKEN